MKKIGIFGGSFDPIHNGHIIIAKEAIKQLELDILYFVPTYINPDKLKSKPASAEDRINMINLVKPEKSEISLFEVNRKSISYTIDTIKYFKTKFKDDQLFLILGSDNLTKLNKWEEIDWIAKNSKIVIFRRNKNINKTNIKKFNILLLKNEIIESSSTNYKKSYFNLVNKNVQKYIGKNFLYANEIAKNALDAKRYKHSVATSIMATKLSKILKYDQKIAGFSGLMHDITKNWTYEEHRKFLIDNNIDETKYENHQLHQLTASIWLKNIYLVDNEEITHAISVHTTLDLDLTILDKIVFMADKICEGRKYEGIQMIRKLALKNFDEAFKKVVKRTWEFNLKKTSLTNNQIEIYKKWSE